MAALCCALCAGVILYVIALYPLALALAARRRSPKTYQDPELQTVSLILAVYNGEEWIGRKLDSILALDYPKDRLEILVISDGSTDATEELARGYADRGVKLIPVPHRGKAAALNAGMERATGEILFFTDVRQMLGRDALRKLVACLNDPRVGVASGELIIGDGKSANGPGLYWRYESWIRQSMSRLGVLQGASGCIYVVRRRLARPLPENTIDDDVYLPMGAFLAGASVVLEPSAKAFDVQIDLQTEFHRKVRTLAGVYQIVGAWPELLWPFRRGSVHFLSHKLGRLALPFALIGCWVSCFWLPFPWNVLLLAPQIAIYGSALLDLAIRPGAPLKRYTAAARTFTALMAAALVALPSALFASHELWKANIVHPRSNP